MKKFSFIFTLLIVLCMSTSLMAESIDGWKKAKWYMKYSELSKLYNFSPSAVKHNIPGCKYTVILNEKAEVNSLRYTVFFGFDDKLRLIDVILSSKPALFNGNKNSKIILSGAVLILDNNSKYGKAVEWKEETTNIINWFWRTRKGVIFFICMARGDYCQYIIAYSTP